MKPVFFDAACRVGKNTVGKGLSVTDTLREMDRAGVARALVRDFALPELGAVKSNQDLVRMLKEEDPDRRLDGVWCLRPEACEELLPPEAFFDAMAENRIRAVTLCPKDHRWIPGRLSIRNYMAEAEKRHVPVLLDGFREDWEAMGRFLEQFPDNIFIELENGWKWGFDQYLRPLMDGFKNLYFSIDGYWVPEGITGLVRRYGAERILFGSRFPDYFAGSAMLQLKREGLTEEEFALIASGNLERLLKGASK